VGWDKVSQIFPIYLDGSGRDLYHLEDTQQQSGFAASCSTHYTDFLLGFDGETYVLNYSVQVGAVSERDLLEDNASTCKKMY
jgi:hypothetical protein